MVDEYAEVLDRVSFGLTPRSKDVITLFAEREFIYLDMDIAWSIFDRDHSTKRRWRRNRHRHKSL